MGMVKYTQVREWVHATLRHRHRTSVMRVHRRVGLWGRAQHLLKSRARCATAPAVQKRRTIAATNPRTMQNKRLVLAEQQPTIGQRIQH